MEYLKVGQGGRYPLAHPLR